LLYANLERRRSASGHFAPASGREQDELTMTEAAPSTTILLVEDNYDNLKIYTVILEFAGFRVITAKDGAEALKMVPEARPDLILMDVAIPEIDGWEVTKRLKADPKTSSIPIIMLTAHALSADRKRAFEVGADGYIPKPADPASVLDAVKKRLEDPSYTVGLPDG
jgi:CheY-like chemotaxis protein